MFEEDQVGYDNISTETKSTRLITLSFLGVFVVSFVGFAIMGTLYDQFKDRFSKENEILIAAVEEVEREAVITEEESEEIIIDTREESETFGNETVPISSVPRTGITDRSESADPLRIQISTVGIDFDVVNPQSRDVSILDKALLGGVVHYPGSGALEDNTNMFLFGHSSHLQNVQNPAFQAFNNLEKVRIGDIVQVYSGEKEYLYRVRSVSLVDANTALVELKEGTKTLTLSTCNNFGDLAERFVVEADFIEEVNPKGA